MAPVQPMTTKGAKALVGYKRKGKLASFKRPKRLKRKSK